MADEIIEELWKIKDGIAHEYAYNVDALVAHLKAKCLSAGQKVVDLGALKPAGQNKKRKNQRQIAERIRIDCESGANHNLIRLVGQARHLHTRKYLF